LFTRKLKLLLALIKKHYEKNTTYN
jgi:hypothetical protein